MKNKNNIMFVRNCNHITRDDKVIAIEATVEANLKNKKKGIIVFDDGDEIRGVDSKFYAPLKKSPKGKKFALQSLWSWFL